MTGSLRTTIVVVDDHKLVRTGLISVLEGEPDLVVVGEASNGALAIDIVADVHPNLVLMDLSMPILDGVDATRRIVEMEPATQVLVLTSFSDSDRVLAALAAGAIGYLLKDCEPAELTAAIRAVVRGESPLDPRVARTVVTTATNRTAADPAASLSPREREVLELVSRGMANKQIARALGIAERTVKVHLGNVFRGIGVSDRTSAALWAKEHL